MTSEIIRIAIADDHKLFMQGISSIVESLDGMKLVFQANNGVDLLNKLESADQLPDVVLMDLKMPEMDGIETTKQLRNLYPDIKIIVLTMMQQEDFILHLFDLGANGYLIKNTSSEELEEAILSVVEKDHYFNDHVSEVMLKGLKRKRVQKLSLDNKTQLTQREREVLELICQEYTTTEMAEKMFVSHRTIETYRKNLLEKIGAKNTAGLIVKSVKSGLISFTE